MVMVVKMIIAVTVIVTTALMMILVSILEGFFQDSDRESICQSGSKDLQNPSFVQDKNNFYHKIALGKWHLNKTIFQTRVCL